LRVQATGLSLSRGSFFNPFFRIRVVDEPMNKDARCMNLVWIEFARFDHDLRFSHRDLAACGRVGIEVTRGSAIDQVPVQIGLPRLHQRQVGLNAALKNIGMPVEFLVLLALATSVPTPVRV